MLKIISMTKKYWQFVLMTILIVCILSFLFSIENIIFSTFGWILTYFGYKKLIRKKKNLQNKAKKDLEYLKTTSNRTLNQLRIADTAIEMKHNADNKLPLDDSPEKNTERVLSLLDELELDLKSNSDS